MKASYPPDFVERHGVAAGDSAGADGRSPFERDRDRILYSSAFRALAGKTQVVASTEIGFQHNRLTHSLKVAQIGKAIATRLRKSDGAKVDPVLVEAACLAHDIGHPPFGHAGESALDEAIEARRLAEWSKAHAGEAWPAVWDGFEGNAQNLRVLTRLAVHKDIREPGLHLTRAGLLATTKYPWLRDPARKGGRKWGAYAGDKDALDWMLLHTPLDAAQVPQEMFEKQIMDWADDVTYAVHDVDDWYRLGFIPLDRLFAFKVAPEHRAAGDDATHELRRFLRWVNEKWTSDGRGGFDHEDVVRMLHRVDAVVVNEPFDGTRHSKSLIESTVSDLISFFVDGATFTGAGQCYDGTLKIDADRLLLCNLLQELVWFYVINESGLAAQQHGQRRIITKLTDWIGEDHERLLPIDRREELDEHQDLTRAIADHISSLTEPMAMSLFGKLSGNVLGAVTDNL